MPIVCDSIDSTMQMVQRSPTACWKTSRKDLALVVQEDISQRWDWTNLFAMVDSDTGTARQHSASSCCPDCASHNVLRVRRNRWCPMADCHSPIETATPGPVAKPHLPLWTKPHSPHSPQPKACTHPRQRGIVFLLLRSLQALLRHLR